MGCPGPALGESFYALSSEQLMTIVKDDSGSSTSAMSCREVFGRGGRNIESPGRMSRNRRQGPQAVLALSRSSFPTDRPPRAFRSSWTDLARGTFSNTRAQQSPRAGQVVVSPPAARHADPSRGGAQNPSFTDSQRPATCNP